MTPSDFIKQLQASHPFREPARTDDAKVLAARYNVAGGESLERSLKRGHEGLAERLADTLRPFPPLLAAAFDQGLVAVGTIEDAKPRAYVKSVGDGFAIIFHTGLANFLFRVARACATRSAPWDNKDLITISFEETTRIIAEIWWFQETETAWGSEYQISEEQILIAGQLTIAAERFLLAHEIGHIIASHPVFLEFTVSEISIVDALDEENYADMLGLLMLIQSHFANEPDEQRAIERLPLEYAGAEFALQVYRALQKVGVPLSSSHPAAGDRVLQLRETFRALIPDDKAFDACVSFATQIARVFDNLIDLMNGTEDMLTRIDFTTDALIKELDDIIQSCSGTQAPEYSKFEVQAAKIFDRGYPLILYEKVAEAYEMADSEMQRYKNDPNEWTSNVYRDVSNRYKLLVYFFARSPEPVRGIFLNALNISDVETWSRKLADGPDL